MQNSEQPIAASAPTDNSNEPSFTGERVIPGQVDSDLFNEHFARYLYAQKFCAGQRILDTGCGVGYGSACLAEVASWVIGLDNDFRAIQYARLRYARPNLEFLVGDCEKLPFPPDIFDLIVSFELNLSDELTEFEAD